MDIGDFIKFTSTGCRGLVVKVTQHEGSHGRTTEFVHVLCGPDVDGEHSDEAFTWSIRGCGGVAR